MRQEELAEILEAHKKWVVGKPGGKQADLSNADLRGADLRGADLRGADPRGADLRGADLRGADLRGADLRGANLSGANLSNADLRGADLRGANLREANLSEANLSGADLRWVSLYRANLSNADLRLTRLREVDLSGADLRGAALCGAALHHAITHKAQFNGVTLIDSSSGQEHIVQELIVYSDLYEHVIYAFVDTEGVPWVSMGCLCKPVTEWDAIGIRKSNPDEYPDDGSEESERRAKAFEFARAAALRLAQKISNKSLT